VQIYHKKYAIMKNILTVSSIMLMVVGIFLLNSSLKPDDKSFTVIIDPGHGGKDPGAVSHGVMEKDIALTISIMVGKMINDSLPEVKVLFTRKKDEFIELHQRSAFANKNKADLFLSIHCNATDNQKAEGTETFVMGLHKNESNLEVAKRENAAILLEDGYQDQEKYGGFDPNSPVGHIIFSLYQNAFLNKSLEIASAIEEAFLSETGMKSRGVKQAGFLVLWKSSMPSVLIETGFLTHPGDRALLQSEEGKIKVTQSIFKAFKSYYFKNKVSP
jgi:N-acetylmuramoyl-L-alanine amidase